MENLPLLSLLILLAAWPVVAAARWNSDVVVVVAPSDAEVTCGGSGSTYGANSTYEANLQHLAAVLQAAPSDSASHGHWPNRVQASASCLGGDSDADCTACIAEAFKEVQRVCPFRREASFFGRHCYLGLAEFSIFSIDGYGNILNHSMDLGLLLQAIGFGWLFFLLFQEWRTEKRHFDEFHPSVVWRVKC